jgi:hypothetical protein
MPRALRSFRSFAQPSREEMAEDNILYERNVSSLIRIAFAFLKTICLLVWIASVCSLVRYQYDNNPNILRACVR